jgi:hypothetical protein
VKAAARNGQLHDFCQVQRMAFGQIRKLGDVLFERPFAGGRVYVLAYLVAIETAQRELDRGAAQPRDDVADARPLDLGVAERADEQRARAMQLARSEFEQRQRISIRRVHVFEHQDQRVQRGNRHQQAGDRVHESETGLLGFEPRSLQVRGWYELGYQFADGSREMRLLLQQCADMLVRKQ